MSPVAAVDPASARTLVAAVGASLADRLAGVTVPMQELLLNRVEEFNGDPALVDLLLASIEGNVVTILRSLQHDINPDHIDPPAAAMEYARRLAQRGVPVSALVRGYRLGQQFLMSEAYAECAAMAPSNDTCAAAYDEIVQRCFDYIDWMSQQVEVAYEDEREAWLANQSNARAAKVRQILEGADVDAIEAERVLGYRARGRHVAVVAWMYESGVQHDQLTRSTRAIRDFAKVIGAGTPLVIGQDSATAWAWLPVRADWEFDPAWTEWRWDQAPAPVLAVGDVHSGLAGFRRSHEEALRVRRVVSVGGVPDRGVVFHEEPGLAPTALMCTDLDATREWVCGVLGDLALDTEGAERHRSTLLTFLRHDMSYTATAEAMVMHKNSIKYRVTAAEGMLAKPLAESRFDVHVALGVCRWLGRGALL
ncbi:MAG: PucR family transcriptional regulator [Marmoricola sp.]